MKKIAVIGSGISGLSTSYKLCNAGHDVIIYAENFPPETTSNKAAAFWFPYHVRNFERGIFWSKRSYDVYHELAQDENTGISLKQLIKVVANLADEDLSWLEFLPVGSCKQLPVAQIPTEFIQAYDVTVPLIETQIFLPWLINKLEGKGVRFVQQKIEDFDELVNKYDWVINCTGLGSRQLCNDENIYPVRGQVALVEPMETLPIFLHNQQPFYIVPRKDATIIGGTFEEYEYITEIQSETLNRLHQQAKTLFPQLKSTTIKGSWAGLRPYRKEIRLEQEGKNIIHNYGHGGSGFTVAWGCAEAVAALV